MVMRRSYVSGRAADAVFRGTMVVEHGANGSTACFVMSNDGQILAQWPSGVPYVYQRTYTFRDYFRGARRLAETGTPGVYVARAFRSESHAATTGTPAPTRRRAPTSRSWSTRGWIAAPNTR
jgi:hypothetical protein